MPMPAGLTLLGLMLPGLMLAAGSPSPSDGHALDGLVDQIYAPYRGDRTVPDAYDRPIWSMATRQLLAAWRGRRGGEADELSDADMLCDCQDWEARDFRVEVLTRQFTGPGSAVLLLRVWPTRQHGGAVRLSLVKEGGRWLVDDVGDPGRGSLVMVLRRAIAR